MKKMSTNTKLLTAIILLSMVLLILALVITFTDGSKSSDDKFKNYLSKSLEEIKNVNDFSTKCEYIDTLKNKTYEDDTKIIFCYKNNEKISIKSNGATDNINNKSYRDIEILDEDSGANISNLSLINEEQIYGLLFKDVVNKYISVDANNLEYVMSNLNIEQENFVDINNSVSDINLILEDISKDSLQNKILSVVAQTNSKQYNSQANRMITLSNSESVTTTCYELTLTTEQTKKCYEIFKKELKILQMDTTGEVENIIVSINVMEDNVVRLTFKCGKMQLVIDFDENTLYIRWSKLIEDETKNVTVKIIRDENKSTIIYQKEDEEKIQFENVILSDNTGTYTLNAKYIYSCPEEDNIEINISQKIKLSDNVIIENSLEQQGNVLLNNYDKKTMNSAVTGLWERLKNRLNIVQNQIQSETLNRFLNYMDEIYNISEEINENEKEKFNNQFEAYKGEEVEQSIVVNLVALAGKNMTSYQMLGEEKIKIYILEGNENLGMAEEIKTKLEGNQKYKISLEYNADSKVSVVNIEKVILNN